VKFNFRAAKVWKMLAVAGVVIAIIAGFVWQRYGGLIPEMMAQDRERLALPKWTDGTNGIIVATTGGYAVDAGLKILREGGNASDAALTTALAETVHASGSYVSFAGVMVALYYDASAGEVYSMNAGYNVPLEENDPLSIPPTGGRTVLVPGFMAGVEALHGRFGKMPWSRLIEPSITLAEHGEPLSGFLALQIDFNKATLNRFPETKKVFTREDGKFYAIRWFGGADLFRQPALAQTLKQVSANGASYMYEGPWARKFVETVRQAGGKITLEDMKKYHVIWDEPVQSTFHDCKVYALGLATRGGVNLIEGLNLLEFANLKALGHWTNSPESLFWFNQIAACGSYLYSPRTNSGRVLSPEVRAKKETSAWIWSQMQSGKWPTLTNTTFASTKEEKHSAAVVVVDQWGNIAVIIHSINSGKSWGTGIFVDGVSVPDSGAFQQRILRQAGPGNRVFTTPSPLLFFRDNKPVLACGEIGSSGDSKTLQVLENIFDFQMSLSAAEKAPAFLWPKFQHGTLVAQFDHRTFNPEILDRLQALGMKAQILSANQQHGFWAGVQMDCETRHLSGAVSHADFEQVAGY
jgi:gamma-glutamyltranspeptidase/glutathione hydrolase